MDWAGYRPVLEAKRNSLVAMRNTVFANMSIAGQAQIVDVSYGGTALFSNVSLASVEVSHGSVVGTLFNDYKAREACPDGDWYYLPEDDAGYDVHITPVDQQNRSMFGEEFVIEDEVMSDCMYVKQFKPDPDIVLPGCPVASSVTRLGWLGQPCGSHATDPEQVSPGGCVVDKSGRADGRRPDELVESAPHPAHCESQTAARVCVPRRRGGAAAANGQFHTNSTGVSNGAGAQAHAPSHT